MLVLSRRTNESVIVGKDIVITVLDVKGRVVKLGIQAPAEIAVHRQEIRQRMAANLAHATASGPTGLPSSGASTNADGNSGDIPPPGQVAAC